jgi:kynurenine formamidase
VSFHGSTFTHLDALCHVAHDGQLYNGFRFADVVSEAGGCAKLGITAFKGGIVTRGVLLDIPRLKGVPYLEPGTQVYIEDVEAWEKKAGVRIAAGDAVFLRTGRWARRAKLGPFTNFAGFDASFAPFMKQRDIALIGSDAVLDAGTVPGFPLAVHKVALVALGVNIFDNADLEALAEAAARHNRWEFLLVAAPIPVPNGTGSLINPIAVF